MGIVKNQKITIRWNATNKKYYEAKNYVYTKMGDTFEIDCNDLPERSKQDILCICDFCGEQCYKMYSKAKVADEDPNDKIACSKCKNELVKFHLHQKYGPNVNNIAQIPHIKELIKNNNLKKYGCENVFGAKEIKDKIKNTNLQRYGVENPQQSDKIKEKTAKTNLEKYGAENVFASNYGKSKIRETNLKKYGKENYVQTEEFQEKFKQASLKHYNCTHPMRSPIVRQKLFETFRKNGGKYASKQQVHYCKLFNGLIDYSLYGCLLDIAFPQDKIYIECDFGGHFVYARLYEMSVKDVLFKDNKRDKKFICDGWKCIRYLNRSNHFPTDNDMIVLNRHLIKILKSTNINRILVDLDDKIIRFEPGFLFKSLDYFLSRRS